MVDPEHVETFIIPRSLKDFYLYCRQEYRRTGKLPIYRNPPQFIRDVAVRDGAYAPIVHDAPDFEDGHINTVVEINGIDSIIV